MIANKTWNKTLLGTFIFVFMTLYPPFMLVGFNMELKRHHWIIFVETHTVKCLPRIFEKVLISCIFIGFRESIQNIRVGNESVIIWYCRNCCAFLNLWCYVWLAGFSLKVSSTLYNCQIINLHLSFVSTKHSGWYSVTVILVICSCLIIIPSQSHVRRVLSVWLYQTQWLEQWSFICVTMVNSCNT